MAQSEARLRASKKYHEKLDEVKFRVPAGERAVIKAHAQQTGESTNAFIYRAVRETIERDQANASKKQK